MVDLTSVAIAVVASLAYAVFGIARALSRGESIDFSKLPATLIAAVFLAIVAPDLVPSDPGNVWLLPSIALTAFELFGAIFVLQRLYEVAVAIYLAIKNRLGALPSFNTIPKQSRSAIRRSKPKSKPQVELGP